MENQALPRQVIKWLDSLDLSFSVRNPRRDLANGFLVAEILTRYNKSNEISILSFYNSLSSDKKKNNWLQISKFLKTKDFDLPPSVYEPILYHAPNIAKEFLLAFYEFLTKRKLPSHSAPKEDAPVKIPHYTQPTASTLTHDRELTRIVNVKDRMFKAMEALSSHEEQLRQNRQDPSLMEYMVAKKKRKDAEQLQALYDEEQKQRALLERSPEVFEIQVKSFNNNTNKKTEQVYIEGREVVEILNRGCASALEVEVIKREIKEMKIEGSKVEFILENPQEFNKKVMKVMFRAIEECEGQLLESVNNNFGEFKKLFALLGWPLEFLLKETKAYRILVDWLRLFGERLIKMDPFSNQVLFEKMGLSLLLGIIDRFPNKRESLIPVIFSFCQNEPPSKLRLMKKVKEIYGTRIGGFISFTTHSIHLLCEDADIGDDFYHLLFFYSMQGLDSSSPITRANSLKILNEISLISYQPVVTLTHKLKKLLKDDWWEVKAQLLIICSNVLLILIHENSEDSRENPEEKASSEEESAKEQFLQKVEDDKRIYLEFVYSLFEPHESINILRISLIYLGPILNYYPELCDRYLQILLEIPESVRDLIFSHEEAELPIVKGCNSFKYKLSGAPLQWYSVGIAKSLDKFVTENSIERFEKEHLQILSGCLVKPTSEEDSETWIAIYENLKRHIFLGFCDENLTELTSHILGKFFTFEIMKDSIMESSNNLFLQILSLVYHPDTAKNCKENLLKFFSFLNEESGIFKEYFYGIIKEFSERSKDVFLNCNLVEFMNILTRERRNNLFGDQSVSS